MLKLSPSCLLALLCCCGLLHWASPAIAEDEPPTPAPAARPQPELKAVLERVSRLERELEELRLKSGQVPADKKDQRLVVLLETPFLGSVHYGSPQNMRFLAGRLLLVNLTDHKLTLKKEDIQLSADGQLLTIKPVKEQLQYHAFQIGQQTMQLRNLETPAELSINSGGTASTWVLFPDLPAGNHVPQLTLKLKVDGRPQDIDVNAGQRDVLGLTVERLGPRKSLGLLTISGTLNSINAGALVDELDRMSTDKVSRVVICWSDSAPILENQIQNWLQNSSRASGRNQQPDSQFPTVPATIRELHLANLPQPGDRKTSRRSNNQPNVHEDSTTAVIAALGSAYETLPRDELVQTLETGTRMERAAALTSGAGRLDSDKLPLILKFADDNDPVIQQAALTALSHFGDESAIACLIGYAHKNVEPLAETAVASLASSRYAAAHQALLKLLGNEPPESKKNIVKVLARYPRPIWADAIYEFVKDPRSGLNVEALNALVQVGHPKLLSVLGDALRSSDNNIRQQAFSLLSTRSDRESEDLAVAYTLEELKDAPPTSTMLALLNRVKDQRALPLLMAQFDATQQKSTLIQTLALLGNEETARQLAEKYPQLQAHDKGITLKALYKLKSPRFHELAGQALLAPDSSLVSGAVQGLQEDGGPEAVRMMIDGLDKSTNNFTWSYLCNGLAVIATSDARLALFKARDSSNKDKRNYAIQALNQLRQRSPGYQYFFQAQALVRMEKWKAAAEQYDMAVQLDPELPDAYAERGNCLLRLEKFEEAGKDFDAAAKIDPYNSQVLTGQCIVMIITAGKATEAVEKLEAARDRFSNNALFSYNAACVYGRALEYLKKHKEVANRDTLMPQYTQIAMADLQKSVQLGFQDMAWMKKDPDLTSLHENPEFQKLSDSKPAPAPKKSSTRPATR